MLGFENFRSGKEPLSSREADGEPSASRSSGAPAPRRSRQLKPPMPPIPPTPSGPGASRGLGVGVVSPVLRFFVEPWAELPAGLSVQGKLLRYLFCGIRLVNDTGTTIVRSSDWKGEEDSMPKWIREAHSKVAARRHSWTGIPAMLFSVTVAALAYHFYLVALRHPHCESKVLDWIDKKHPITFVAHEVGFAMVHWVGSQTLVRYVFERPTKLGEDVSWKSLLILENAAWLLFICAEMIIRIMRVVKAIPELDAEAFALLFIYETLHNYRSLVVFTVLAPVLAFHILPHNHAIFEALFYVIMLPVLMIKGYSVLYDAECTAVEIERLQRDFGATAGVVMHSFEQFYRTHSFCLSVCVYHRNHVRETFTVEPDVFMIAELLWPMSARRYCRVCAYMLLAGLVGGGAIWVMAEIEKAMSISSASGMRFRFGHWDAMFGCDAFLSVSWHMLMQAVFVGIFIRNYFWFDRAHSAGTFQATNITFSCMVSMVFYYSFIDAQYDVNLKNTAVYFMDIFSHLGAALLCADVVGKRLKMPNHSWDCFYLLLFSMWRLADWSVLQSDVQLTIAHGADVPRGDSPTAPAAVDANASRLMRRLGTYAAVESCLLQLVGWIGHTLEGLEPELQDPRALRPPLAGQPTVAEEPEGVLEEDVHLGSEKDLVGDGRILGLASPPMGPFGRQSSTPAPARQLSGASPPFTRQSSTGSYGAAAPVGFFGRTWQPRRGQSPSSEVWEPPGSWFKRMTSWAGAGVDAPPDSEGGLWRLEMMDFSSSPLPGASASSSQQFQAPAIGPSNHSWMNILAGRRMVSSGMGTMRWGSRQTSCSFASNCSEQSRLSRWQQQRITLKQDDVEVESSSSSSDPDNLDAFGSESGSDSEANAGDISHMSLDGRAAPWMSGDPSSPRTTERSHYVTAVFQMLTEEQACGPRRQEPSSSEPARLDSWGLRRYAALCRFGGDDKEWAEEYTKLCNRRGWVEEEGVCLEQFRQLATDASEVGYFMSTSMRNILKKLL